MPVRFDVIPTTVSRGEPFLLLAAPVVELTGCRQQPQPHTVFFGVAIVCCQTGIVDALGGIKLSAFVSIFGCQQLQSLVVLVHFPARSQ